MDLVPKNILPEAGKLSEGRVDDSGAALDARLGGRYQFGSGLSFNEEIRGVCQDINEILTEESRPVDDDALSSRNGSDQDLTSPTEYLEANWGNARFPETDLFSGSRIACLPQEQFLRQYSAYWKKRGAIAIDPHDISDSHIRDDMQAKVTGYVRSLARGSEGMLMESDAVSFSATPAFPRHPRDLGLSHNGSRRLIAGANPEEAAQARSRDDRLANRVPVQFKIPSSRNASVDYYALAILRDSNGDSVGYFGQTLMPVPAPELLEGALDRENEEPFRPFVATEIRVTVSTRPEEQYFSPALGHQIWQHNDVPSYQINVLYSARAFEIARESLIRNGMGLGLAAQDRVHAHLVRTIADTVLDHLQNGDKNGRMPPYDLGCYRSGDAPQVVEAIEPMRGGSPNDFKVFCACGDKRFVFQVTLHIWFPGKDALSVKLSNRYHDNPLDECPFLVRCAFHPLTLPKDMVGNEKQKK
ncbi:MAG: hypothetical protein J0M12_03350 [Deltaproteobacteria bacterium]|nr:hypothetical protein [Deltaproteobacteria bacterium]